MELRDDITLGELLAAVPPGTKFEFYKLGSGQFYHVKLRSEVNHEPRVVFFRPAGLVIGNNWDKEAEDIYESLFGSKGFEWVKDLQRSTPP